MATAIKDGDLFVLLSDIPEDYSQVSPKEQDLLAHKNSHYLRAGDPDNVTMGFDVLDENMYKIDSLILAVTTLTDWLANDVIIESNIMVNWANKK